MSISNTDTISNSPSSIFPRSFRRAYASAVRGEGVYLWDSNGKRYLDFSGSAAVNFIGHGVREIGAAMAGQARQLEFVHSSQFTTPVAEQYALELLDFADEKFRGGRVFFCCGGSEAIETALKLARQYQVEIGQTRRHVVVSRNQSYHGATLGALAVSGNRRRREIYLPMLREFTHIGVPYCYRCAYNCDHCAAQFANEVERTIDTTADEVAAFVLEPVSGATLGAVVPPNGYLQRVAQICRDRGALLIADEVMTGMGRTGRNFAVEHWNVVPDILVTAKGLSSGYAPLGAVIATAKIAGAIANGSGTFLHGFTNNAHPISLAAGQAVLRLLHEQSLVREADSGQPESAATKLARALATLSDLDFVGDVRGIGLLWGIEFVADKASKQPFAPELNIAGKVGQAAMDRGLLVYSMQGCVNGVAGDHLLLAPPAVISEEEIGWAVSQLRAAIQAACTGN